VWVLATKQGFARARVRNRFRSVRRGTHIAGSAANSFGGSLPVRRWLARRLRCDTADAPKPGCLATLSKRADPHCAVSLNALPHRLGPQAVQWAYLAARPKHSRTARNVARVITKARMGEALFRGNDLQRARCLARSETPCANARMGKALLAGRRGARTAPNVSRCNPDPMWAKPCLAPRTYQRTYPLHTFRERSQTLAWAGPWLAATTYTRTTCRTFRDA
jgi:hypothetical protein